MPENFKSSNGATLSGHSEKWSDKNRRANSHAAGQGSRGSRNQGTGEAGKANTVASQGTDTSKMNPHEKLKYFNSLGLLNPTQKKQLADMDAAQNAPQQPKDEPKAQATPSAQNPVKELSDRLMKIFARKPDLLQGIVKTLQAVPKEQMKDAAQRVLDSMKGNISTEPTEVFSTVMRAIEQKAQPEEQDDIDFDEVEQEAPRNRSGKMSEKEFRETNAYLGADFVDSIIKQVKQFEPFEEALFTVDMAIENVDDVNDVRAVRNSMASAADDLGTRFELVQDSTEEDDGYISDDNRQWDELVNFFKADSPAGKDTRVNPERAQMIIDKIENRLEGDNLDKMRLAKTALDKAMQKYVPGEKSRYETGMNAVFDAFKKYEAENGQEITPDGYLKGTKSTEQSGEIDVSNMSPGIKHAYERDKEAYNAPDLETGLDILRKSKGHEKELKEVLQYFADEMKKEGAKPASINKTLNHYMSQLKDNYYKFLKAQNAMIDNADAYDPDEGSEIEHNMLSFEGAMEDYDRGQLTDHEEGFIELYNYLHGEK